MLLGNDAAEGQTLSTPLDAETLSGQLRNHLQSLTKTMGLGSKPMNMEHENSGAAE